MVESKHQSSFYPPLATALTLSTHHSTMLRCFMRVCEHASQAPMISSASALPPARLPGSPAQPNSPHVPVQIPHSQGRSPRPCRPKSLLRQLPTSLITQYQVLTRAWPRRTTPARCDSILGSFLGAMRRHHHRQGPELLAPASIICGPWLQFM